MSKYNVELNTDAFSTDSILLKRIDEGSVVLEFGASYGRMTKYLSQQKNCKVYCVEIDAEAAKSAAQYSVSCFVGDIEQYMWVNDIVDVKFDFILFADVLEHLRRPKDVLMKVGEYLKQDGSIVLSIPNISHNAIIMNLLNDKFDYKDTGLLDNTHIHFFTRNNFEVMANASGYKPVFLDVNSVKPKRTEFNIDYGDFSFEVASFLKNRSEGEVYQYCYELKRKDSPIEKVNIDSFRNQTENNCQLYFDTGNGFNEIECIRWQNINEGCIPINEISNVRNIRFDPNDSASIIAINYLSVIDHEGNEFACEIELSNAKYLICDRYIFYTEDPQLLLKIPITNPKYFKFSMKLEDTYLSSLSYKLLLSDLENKSEEIENEKKLVENEKKLVQLKERELKSAQEKNDLLTSKINYITENSFVRIILWLKTKFVRQP